MTASQALRSAERSGSRAASASAPFWQSSATSIAIASTSASLEPHRNSAFVPQRRPDQSLDGGVHLPFLAQMLCGVRVRANRGELEFILPNPSGGRGVYIAAWSVVTGFAAPSLHDTLLVGRLSGRDAIGPADVREAARAVALEGYAGQAAADAARRGQAALEVAALRLRAQFLLTLARRDGVGSPEDEADCLGPEGFNRLAARLGWRGPHLAKTLERLSVQFASVAVGGSMSSQIGVAGSGRWGQLMSLMHRLRLSLAEEQFRRFGPDAMLLGRVIVAADRCIRQAEILIPEIETMLSDPLPLLEAWRDARGGPASWLLALETAFDGWDRICLLWFDARTARARQSLLPEMASLARAGGNADGWSPGGRRWAIGTGEPTGAEPALDEPSRLIARNERIRTQELTFELDAF